MRYTRYDKGGHSPKASRRADPQTSTPPISGGLRTPAGTGSSCIMHHHPSLWGACRDRTKERDLPTHGVGGSPDPPTKLLDPPKYVGPQNKWVRGTLVKSGKRARVHFSLATVACVRPEWSPGGDGPACRSHPHTRRCADYTCEQAASLPFPHLLCCQGGPGRGAQEGNLRPKWRREIHPLFKIGLVICRSPEPQRMVQQ